MQQLIKAIAKWWLFDGAKYRLSRWLYRKEWDDPITLVDLTGCKHPTEVAEKLHGHAWYESDRLWGLIDLIRPPARVLRRAARIWGRGGDCDDMAMLHARAIAQVLPEWEPFIVSALAKPFVWSHHFCICRDPISGWWWVIQPQPTLKQDRGEPNAYGGYSTLEEGLRAVEYSYQQEGMERYVSWDIRDPDWQPISKEEKL